MAITELLQEWKMGQAKAHYVRRMAPAALVLNRGSKTKPTERQVTVLTGFAWRVGLDVDDFIELGIAEGRLHPDCRFMDPDDPDQLGQLTGPEVGSLFCFVDFLKELRKRFPRSRFAGPGQRSDNSPTMPSYLHIETYYAKLQGLVQFGGSNNELNIRRAFENCLDAYCQDHKGKLA